MMLSVRYLKQGFFTAFVAVGLSVFAGCSGGTQKGKISSDQIFHSTLLKVMPDFKLTSAILGKPVIPSSGYGMTVGGRTDPIEINSDFVAFMSEFQRDGARKADIYFRKRVGKDRVYYKASFPGCAPKECRINAKNTNLEVVSLQEYERYASPKNVE